MIERMYSWYNNKSIEIIKWYALTESFESLIKITKNEMSTLRSYFTNVEATVVETDLNSFKFVAKWMVTEITLNYIIICLSSKHRMNLKKEINRIIIVLIPVSTVTAERFFSTNRIMNKIKNRIWPET